MRKDYFSHDLRIDSHNTFPGSLATIENLLLGTPCYLSCCRMRYSRIMRTWFLMSRYWRILFQKVKRIATPLLSGKQCPTRAIYRLEKPSTYTTCHCVEFGQNLATHVEKLIMLSRSRSCILHTYICRSYTGSTQKHVFHPPKNILLLHWE